MRLMHTVHEHLTGSGVLPRTLYVYSKFLMYLTGQTCFYPFSCGERIHVVVCMVKFSF